MGNGKSAAVGALFLLSVLLAAVGQVSAQGQEVRLDGRVEWIAGQLMVVQLDSAAASASISRECLKISIRCCGGVTAWSSAVSSTM